MAIVPPPIRVARYEQAKGHKERYEEETCEEPDGEARRKEGKESDE